ncbi:hypothetical protein [Enterovirga rhinocerotis]|uniref:Uncharacterized protein n=1 Tax=Enterovirga rhinocerotis TaxID=1339210 RepID=A0A4R7C7K6_9HYPH|nr:hypothetical protein [Enterovirga rhinocerotis]TDR94388.1 hypothetical protein EV668_1675 [Enterovirga rhinocerotis]
MRLATIAGLLVALSGMAAGGPAYAQQSCSAHRAACESVCTPNWVSYYYAGSMRRCTASCEPRWQECLRTGTWVDLERRRTGWWEVAKPY